MAPQAIASGMKCGCFAQAPDRIAATSMEVYTAW